MSAEANPARRPTMRVPHFWPVLPEVGILVTPDPSHNALVRLCSPTPLKRTGSYTDDPLRQ